MKGVLRWLLRGLLASAVVVAIALAFGWVLVSGSLPNYGGRVLAHGLEQPAEIIRDSNAVPHIRAASEHDAWFALGIAHAQDRLWQMELSRRAAQGRLSALLGPRTLGLDRLAKTLDIYGLSRAAVAHQSDPARAALEAYAAGVNAWIRHVNANSLGRGAPEFFAFPTGLAPWTPADSLAILKMMALRLSSAARSEVRRALFQLALPPERIADILPEYPVPAQTAIRRFAELFPGARFARPSAAAPADPWLSGLGPAVLPEEAGASNAWAVDASRSSSQAPLLANDPHLWLSAPSVWYLADLAGGARASFGGTLPGVPAVLIGHNGTVGWGLTTAHVDDQDLFIEQVNPDNPAEYRTPQGWAPFERRRIRIEVDGADPVVFVARATRHGPVLEGDMFGASAVTPEGHVAALAWTALHPEDRSYTALYRLGAATNVAEGMEASALARAPAQVVTLADGRDIAMVLAGAVPERAPRSPTRGRLPTPGWLAENDWVGLLAPDAKPRLLSPSEGALANANNKLTNAPYPRHLSYDWARPYRIRRIEKELAGQRFHSRDSFIALQNDTVSEMARAVLPLIARDLWWTGTAKEGPEIRIEALERLAEWNGEMDQHSPEPLIFYEWLRQLTRRLAADELGGLLGEVSGPRPLFVERVFRDLDGASVWCDITKTPEREDCATIAAAALDDGLARLARTYGRSIDGWRWGEAHAAVHRHTPLGLVAGIGLLFNIEHETSGGDFTLMRGLSTGRGAAPFRNVHAAGLRMVLDFASLDRSRIMISTGQSGHPFSRWYDHLAEPWARGDMILMSTDDDDARSGAVGVMLLTPAGP